MIFMRKNRLSGICAVASLGVMLGLPGAITAEPLSPSAVKAQAAALPEAVFTDVPRELFRSVNSTRMRKSAFPWGLPQVEQLRPGFLGDDQLDDQERRLLAEFQKPLFHVRLVALKSPVFAPDDLVLAGTFTEEARVELAKFAPLEGREQLALWLDSSTVGWTKAVAYARKSDEQQEEVIDVLVGMLGAAAKASNLENRYEPFKQRLERLHNAAGMQKGEDNTFARITLLRTAADLVHDSGRNGIPLFMINWIKRGEDEMVEHLLPPVLLATLREMMEAKPFPWGEAEAERLAAVVRSEGAELERQLTLVIKAWLKPKFRLHLVARTPVSGSLDALDLDGSFAPGTTGSLRQLLPADAASTTK